MKINKLSDSKYEISGLIRPNIIRDICELFNISTLIKSDEIVLNDVNSVVTYRNWEKDNHPLIDYISSEKIFDNFAAISLYLEKLGMQLSHLDPTHILVVNSSIFIPINLDDLYIIKKSSITVHNMYDKNNPYLSLELKNNTKIPFTVNYKCFYSSLALLVYDKLIGINNDSHYNEDLLVIYGSRLYWLLKYCLLEKPEDRIIVIM